MNEIYDDLVMI